MHNILINNHDITDHIIEGTYQMDASESFESWKDGNFNQHRIIVTSKVNGSFEVVCSNKTGSITLATFASYIQSGVNTCLMYVTNKGYSKAINAYIELDNKKHELMADGTFLDIITVKIEER